MRRNCLVRNKAYDSYYASRIAVACEDVLRAIGVDIVSCISCGVEGCVYKLSDPNSVAKFTRAEEEAVLSAWLMAQKQLPASLPRIVGVWEIPDKCIPKRLDTDDAGYLILREDLGNMPVDAYEDLRDALWLFVDNLKALLQGTINLDAFNTRMQAASKKLGKRDKKHFKQVTAALDFFVEHEFVPADLHPDNLGLRSPDQAVIRDLGLSSYSIPKIEIESF